VLHIFNVISHGQLGGDLLRETCAPVTSIIDHSALQREVPVLDAVPCPTS
jgi:hypothetical protein